MRINATALPAPNEIDHPEIAAAAAKYAEAQATLRDAQRAVAKLTDDRAEQAARDADAAEAFKSGRKCIKHLQAHRAARDEADGALRVARLAEQAAREAFQKTVDEHAAEWIADLERQADALDEAWTAADSAVKTLHEERTRAHQRVRMVDGESKPIGVATFKPSDLAETVTGERLTSVLAQVLDDPAARHRQRVTARPEVVLDALSKLGEPEEIPEWRPGGLVADLFREHARAVQRGYSVEEAHSGNAPAVDQRRYLLNGVPRPPAEPVGVES